jgi:diguanylate cyclase (GGDEF)-like protein
MLFMSVLIHVSWLSWKLYIYFQHDLWKYVNIDLLKQCIPINLAVILILIVLMIPCWLFRQNAKAQHILPYLCVIFFGVSMCRDAYLTGIMSPATSITLVISVTLGLVLFERRLIYSSALICLSILGWLLYKTIKGELVYAPLFITLDMVDPTESTIFWTFSMLWFMFPILFGGMVLLEVLLTQWRRREEKVHTLSQIDPLTGLFNRRTTHDRLSYLIKAKDGEAATHAVILLDLDLFKNINDVYGHSVGDEVLKLVAENLQSNVRDEDMVGRFGGEEFIIILANTSLQQTEDIAERCRSELMKLKLSAQHAEDLVITASFGVACFKAGQTTIDTILKEADEALYQAKHLGRNQIVLNQMTISSF